MTSRAALARLPVTRKSALIELQRQRPPFAGLTASAPGALKRIFASPGPIYDPEGHGPDWWRFARALFAAGFRRGDIVHNAFAYHFTPAGAMIESGALALDCAVFPGGVGQTEAQARAIAEVRSTGYAGTPSFLKLIHEKGRELGLDLSSLDKALVSGEGAARGLARRDRRLRYGRAAMLRQRRSRPDRLRVRGARGHDPRRAGDPRDRPPGHPAIRCRTARSARSWSPASIPTIR